MKVLIACEYSGAVRDAFTELGHWAVSCDILPSESIGWHYMGDVLSWRWRAASVAWWRGGHCGVSVRTPCV